MTGCQGCLGCLVILVAGLSEHRHSVVWFVWKSTGLCLVVSQQPHTGYRIEVAIFIILEPRHHLLVSPHRTLPDLKFTFRNSLSEFFLPQFDCPCRTRAWIQEVKDKSHYVQLYRAQNRGLDHYQPTPCDWTVLVALELNGFCINLQLVYFNTWPKTVKTWPDMTRHPGRGGQTEVTPDQTSFERTHVPGALELHGLEKALSAFSCGQWSATCLIRGHFGLGRSGQRQFRAHTSLIRDNFERTLVWSGTFRTHFCLIRETFRPHFCLIRETFRPHFCLIRGCIESWNRFNTVGKIYSWTNEQFFEIFQYVLSVFSSSTGLGTGYGVVTNQQL